MAGRPGSGDPDQHFLVHEGKIRSIVDAAAIRDSDRVVELGAGAGTIARSVPACRELVLVELDPGLAASLEGAVPGAVVLQKDALELLPTLEADVLLINLPGHLTEAVLRLLPGLAFRTAVMAVPRGAPWEEWKGPLAARQLVTLDPGDFRPYQPFSSTAIVIDGPGRPSVSTVVLALEERGDPERARHAQRYFKTGPGEYGEGDRFLGLRAADVRAVVRRFRNLPRTEVEGLLESPWHEARLAAVLILVEQYRRGDEDTRREIVRLYLDRTSRINNWDLVDASAHKILGPWIRDTGDQELLTRLTGSASLWERRMAIMATLEFIRNGEFEPTFRAVGMVLGDSEDLIQKAAGWMLREVGNRDRPREEAFLESHYSVMPRTMLRYAIERFPEERRQAYLKGTV